MNAAIQGINMVNRQREYLVAIAPFTKMICDVYSVAMPSFKLLKDGIIEPVYEFSASQDMALKYAQESINLINQKFLNVDKSIYNDQSV